MGCDIHVFVEFRDKDPKSWNKDWRGFGGQFYIGRDYSFFGRLAGVREGQCIVDVKPLPTDLSWNAENEYYTTIIEDNEAGCEGQVCRSTAEQWIARGCSKLHPKKLNQISGPDWHNAGCVDLNNWRKAVKTPRGSLNPLGNVQSKAISKAMKELEDNGYETRVVFWFDN